MKYYPEEINVGTLQKDIETIVNKFNSLIK
jgi:hypothetical protein